MARARRASEAANQLSSRGRPRRGLRSGERVRDYPTLTVRVPSQTRALLKAIGSHMQLPMWLTVRHLTICFVRDLPPGDRRRLMRYSRTNRLNVVTKKLS